MSRCRWSSTSTDVYSSPSVFSVLSDREEEERRRLEFSSSVITVSSDAEVAELEIQLATLSATPAHTSATLNVQLQQQQQQQSPSIADQTGAGSQGLTFSPRRRASAFQHHLEDIEFLPDHHTEDLVQFLRSVETPVRQEIIKALAVHNGLKCWLVLSLVYENVGNGVLTDPIFIRAPPFIVHNSHNIDLLAVAEDLLNLNANTIKDKSGLRIFDVQRLDLQIAEYKPLSGSGY